MVAKLAKSGEEILSDLTPVEAHVLHMWVGSGEVFELMEAYAAQQGALAELEAAFTSPLSTGSVMAERRGMCEDRTQMVLKELGDVCFYVTGYRIGYNLPDYVGEGAECRRLGTDYIDALRALSVQGLMLELGIRFADATDATKRIIIYRYGHEQVPVQLGRLVRAIDQVEVVLDLLFSLLGFTREGVLKANMEKLAVGRFPNGYSDAAAAARADVPEGKDDLSVGDPVVLKPAVEAKEVEADPIDKSGPETEKPAGEVPSALPEQPASES